MVQRNGIRSGGKIVGGYLSAYLKSFSVGAGEILFITGGIGDKAHYRAYGVAEELGLHGFRAAVTVSDNPCLSRLADRFKIFVFHKVSCDKKIRKFIEIIKKQGKEIIFDTDDLDFDPQHLSSMEYLSQISPAERVEYAKGIGAEILNDPYVKVATTTVAYLAEKLRQKDKRVFVVSNKISESELGIAEKVAAQKKKDDGCVRIGYYSGTPSHNKDFATITAVLAEILEKYENVKLVLAGPLDMEDKLSKFGGRIEILPRVSREKYYANLYRSDINIVPLEMKNPFCEAKSEIKFIEAGILGIPTVAVRNRTFSEAISDGQDGLLAGTREEWAAAFEKLITDANLRRQMGEKARQKVLRDYTVKNSHSMEYYAYLEEKVKK